jgi:hypothetical protein
MLPQSNCGTHRCRSGIRGLSDISNLRSCGLPVDPGLFVDANDLSVNLAAKLDFTGPSVET